MKFIKQIFCSCDNEYFLKVIERQRCMLVWEEPTTDYLLTVSSKCKKCDLEEECVLMVRLFPRQYEAFKKFGAWEKFKETRDESYILDWREY